MALDQATLDTGTPRTRDGRSYPDHLRPYEAYDAELLESLDRVGEASPNEFALAVGSPRLRSVVSRWLASAEWRGLIERHDEPRGGRRTYALSDRGQVRLRRLQDA